MDSEPCGRISAQRVRLLCAQAFRPEAEPGEDAVANIVVRRWSEEEWIQSRARWNDILDGSTGDPIFSSWEWQTGWWRHFGQTLGGELLLLSFERNGKLIGLMPAYLTVVRRRGLRLRSVQMVGHHFRNPDALISEYLDVIAKPDCARDVARAGVAWLLGETACDEFVVSFGRAGSVVSQALRDSAYGRGGYCRGTDYIDAYAADLTRGFGEYLGSLGGSSRRSLYLLRRRLEGHGSIHFDHASLDELIDTLNLMNRLHSSRWGEPAFTGQRLAFHQEYARAMSAVGRLFLSRLWVGDRVVSVLYDVVGSRGQYNLQMGFDQTFSERVSLGRLHFGYALEHAASRNVGRYDFLAGTGRRTQYKASLSQEIQRLSTTQLLTKRWIGTLYRLHDSCKPSDRREPTIPCENIS